MPPKNQIYKGQIKIKEFDVDLIQPNAMTVHDPEQGGTRSIFIGKSGSGKSTVIASIMYAKKDLIPVGEVQSGTEETNRFFRQFFPRTMIHYGLNLSKLADFRKRQIFSKKYISNPWTILILDDVTENPSILRKPIFQDIFKTWRHRATSFFLNLNYCKDIIPSIRTNTDFVFIFREPILENRHNLFKLFASIIGDFTLFCMLMDAITEDRTALVIHMTSQSNNWQDCVFWYKSDKKFGDKIFMKSWRFGCPEFWEFAKEREDPNLDELD